jgi:hypothetical protein
MPINGHESQAEDPGRLGAIGSAGDQGSTLRRTITVARGHDVTLVDPVEARLPLLDRMY